MRVNQYYNNPRCCPSRASVMTGLYSQQAGMGMMVADYGRYPFPGYAGILSSKTITIPEALKTVGYNTAMVGKWHLAPEDPKIGMGSWPLQRGFDKYWGIIAGASVYFKSTKLYEGNDPLPAPAENLYLTDLFAEHAAGYVAELAQEKKPFFLYTAFNAPHWPIQAPEEVIQKYANRYAGGWDELRAERHKKQIEMGLVDERWPLSPRDPRVPAWQHAQDKEWEMRRMAVYAAMIDRLDQGIGRILDQVEKSGIADNTLIVFMSDNGGNWEEIAPRRRMIPESAIAAHLHTPCESRRRLCRQCSRRDAGNDERISKHWNPVGQLRKHAIPALQALCARRRHQFAVHCLLAARHQADRAARECGWTRDRSDADLSRSFRCKVSGKRCCRTAALAGWPKSGSSIQRRNADAQPNLLGTRRQQGSARWQVETGFAFSRWLGAFRHGGRSYGATRPG